MWSTGPQAARSAELLYAAARAWRKPDRSWGSSVPGAKDAYASLERRRLTAGLVQEIKGTIARARGAMESLPPAADLNSAEVARSRRDACEKLSLWYTDWAETFRAELGYHHLVRLGLTARRGGRRAGVEEPVADDATEI